jgi:xanthine/uracil permease
MSYRRLAAFATPSIAALLLFIPALTAQAATLPSIVPCNGVDCSICDIVTLGQRILNTAVYLAVILSAFVFAYAGFLFLTAGGDVERYSKAKRTFVAVFIGIVIVLVAWTLVHTLMSVIAGKEDGSIAPWSKIC